MNLPNKLTMLRILLIPVFMVFVEWDSLPGHILWAFVIFVAASLTDYIDGYIARKNNMVTDFGKFMDPLADKILVTAALVYFIPLGLAPAWDGHPDSGKGISGDLAAADRCRKRNRDCGGQMGQI